MNITNGTCPTNNAYNTYNVSSATTKTDYANINTVTAKDILESIRALGVASVDVSESDSTFYKDTRQGGFHLTISPCSLQRLIDDPIFRESQFEIIRNNVEVVNDPRYAASLVNEYMTIGVDTPGLKAHWQILSPHIDGLFKLSLSDFAVNNEELPSQEKVEEQENNFSKIQSKEKDNKSGHNLSQILFQNYMNQFVPMRDLLAKKNEEATV